MTRPPVIRTPFTDRDKALIDAMAGARLNSTGGTRLVSSLYESLKTTPDLGMTDAQRQWLSDLAYTHRKQIPESVRLLYPRIFAPEPPPFEEIMHLMTDDEILDATGAGQEWEPDAENPQDEALPAEIEHKADATERNQTYSCQEPTLWDAAGVSVILD
jgi:hypothetical protein